MTDRIDRKHRAFVRSLNCVGCGATPSECAHVRMSHFEGVTVPLEERGGTGLKPADKWCVPLCRECHARQHQSGENTFWNWVKLNPLALAQSLYRNTGNYKAAQGILYRVRMGEAI